MKLIDFIRCPLASVKIYHYSELGQEPPRIDSDLFAGVFTDEGSEFYNDILQMPVVAIAKKSNIIYLQQSNGDDSFFVKEITDFWNLFTHYGPYRWQGSQEPKRQKDNLYELHRRYFNFTDELVK